MSKPSDEELVLLADANLSEFHREHVRWLPPGSILEPTDLLLSAAGTRAPGPWNSALPLGPRAAVGAQVLESAARFFEPLQRAYLIFTRAHLDADLDRACERAGLAYMGDNPGMALLQPVAAAALADGVTIERVSSAAAASSFADVMAEAYEELPLTPAVTRKLLSQPARWIQPHCEAFLLCERQQPLAGALLLWSHGIAGVYWVGTLRAARGRGYADAITRFVSNRALEGGARAVVLQASRAGEPIYRRMGYEEITRYRRYFVPKAE